MYEDEDYENQITIDDPLEQFNRIMFDFDMYLLEKVATPVMNQYNKYINKHIRKSIANFGDRLYDPITLINSILQLDIKNSLKTVGTFTVNMTVGCLGLFNPAKKWNIYRDKRSIGDVLAFYNFNHGFYLVLPFLGPTTLRDGLGLGGDYMINPLSYNVAEIGAHHSWIEDDELIIPKYIIQYVDDVNKAVSLNEKFLSGSLDKYTFVKNSYIQNREQRINNINKNSWVKNVVKNK